MRDGAPSVIVAAMADDRITATLVIVGGIAALTYVAAGIVGAILIDWDDSAGGDRALWVGFLVGGGALLLAGLWALRRASPWVAAALVSVGAIAGAIAMFWSVLVPVAAIVRVVLSVLRARRVTTETA